MARYIAGESVVITRDGQTWSATYVRKATIWASCHIVTDGRVESMVTPAERMARA